MLIDCVSTVSEGHRSVMVGMLLLHYNLLSSRLSRLYYSIQGIHPDFDAISGTEVKTAHSTYRSVKANATAVKMSVERQLRPLSNVPAQCRRGLFFKRTTGKYTTALKPFHFFNVIPFDFIISNSILTLKPILQLIYIS